MKIVFINRYFWPDESATSQLLSDLAFHLVDHGHVVTVITGKYGYHSGSQEFKEEETKRGVRILRTGGNPKGRVTILQKIWDYLGFYGSALPHFKKESKTADWVICLTDPPMLSVYTAWFGRKGARQASWCMDIFPEIGSLHSGNPVVRGVGSILAKARNQSFKQMNKLIVLGEDMGSFCQQLGVPLSKIEVVHNWALQTGDSSTKENGDREIDLKSQLKISNRFTVGYSGNLGRVHEPGTFVKAVAATPLDWEGQYLFFSGGRNLETIKESIPEERSHLVHYKNPQPRELLSQSLRIPDVHWFSLFPHFTPLVFPSKFAGILGAARPVIFVGKAESEIGRLIQDHDCGVVVAPGDGEGFFKAAETLRVNQPLRTAMGAQAYALYQSMFTREISLSRWISLLQTDHH